MIFFDLSEGMEKKEFLPQGDKSNPQFWSDAVSFI